MSSNYELHPDDRLADMLAKLLYEQKTLNASLRRVEILVGFLLFLVGFLCFVVVFGSTL